ncbi:hypothetical protein ACEPAI_4289 [Sanghuangporus weigelae]
MFYPQESIPTALEPTRMTNTVHVKAIEVVYKVGRPKRPISLRIKVGKDETLKSPLYEKDKEIIWNVEKQLPSMSQSHFALVIREHHTLRKSDVVNINIAVDDMFMKPVFVIDEPNGEALIINVRCEAAGPFIDLIHRLVAEAQCRLSNMKLFLERFNEVCETLNRIINITESVTNIHPALAAAVAAATMLYETCRKQRECHEAATTLIADISDFLPFTEIPVGHLKGNLTEQAVNSLLSAFEKIARVIIDYSSNNILGALLNDRTAEIDEYKKEFKKLKDVFDWCVKTEMWKTVLRIETHTENMLLTLLHPIRPAFYSSEKSCLEGTRQDTLQTIHQWMESGSKLLWLHGPEGSGKTTITHTIAQRLDEENRLAGCFIYDSDANEHRISERIIPTIAYQLAKWHAGYRSIILDILQGNVERSIHTSLHAQFDILLKGPILKLSESNPRELLPPPHKPLVIVLDAPDECCDSIPKWRLLVKFINDVAGMVPWLNVFISSRKPPQFDLLSGTGYQELDINGPVIDLQRDIAVFLRYCVKGANPATEGHHALEYKVFSLSSWIRLALRRSSKWISPHILTRQRDTSGQSWIDEIFLTALFGVLYVGDFKEESLPLIRDVLVIVSCIASSRPTTVEVLPFMHLIKRNITLDVLDATIASLFPILLRDGATRVHIIVPPTDFLGFISDKQRSGSLWVEVKSLSHGLAQNCLHAMISGLRMNICDLEAAHLVNSDVERLEHKVVENVSGFLRCSSLSWMDLITITGDSRSFQGMVLQILSFPKALQWIEVLGLIGSLQAGKRILRKCADFYKDEECILRAVTVLFDFISVFEPAMTSSICHTYASGLVWLPSDSPIYSGTRPRIPKLAFESFPRSDPSVVNLSSATDVFCTALSLEGRKIVSGSRNGTLEFWDGLTGDRIGGKIKGHTDWISDLKYSPNGTKFVSGSYDGTVKIWDARNGRLLFQLESSSVFSAVVFAPGGSEIVSGHWDGKVRIWDVQIGALVSESQTKQEAAIFAVARSSDGRRIVTGSYDGTLRILDAQNAGLIGYPLEGHEYRVRCVAYSPDGSRIISGSDDKSVRVWNAHTGEPIGEPLRGHEDGIVDVGYSRDGNRIYSASWDRTIRFWNAMNGSPTGVISRGESRWDPERQCFVSIPKWWPISSWKSFTTQSLVYSSNPLYISDDGWIRTLDEGLLLWVPPDHRCCRCHAASESTITTNDCDGRLKSSAWKDLPQWKDWTNMMNAEESG